MAFILWSAATAMAENDSLFYFKVPSTNLNANTYMHFSTGLSSGFNFSESIHGDECYQKAVDYFAMSNYDSACYFYDLAGHYFENACDWEHYCRSLIGITNSHLKKRNYAKAENCINDVELYALNYLDKHDAIHADIESLRGILLLKLGKKNVSVNHFIHAIEIRLAANGSSDPELSKLYNKLGVNYYMLGEFDIALENYNEALRLNELIYEEKGLTDAELYNNIGIIYKLKGDFVEALDFYNRSIALKEEFLEPDDPNLASTYTNLGNLNLKLAKYDLAMNFYEKAEKIFKERYGDKHPAIGKIYTNMGIIFKEKGDYEKSLHYLEYALSIIDQEVDKDVIAPLFVNLGNVYFRLEKYKEALNYYKQSADIREDDNSMFLARTYSNYAMCYDKLDQSKKSNKYHELAIESRIEYFGEKHYLLATEYMNYGNFCIEQNQKRKGIDLYYGAYDIYVANFTEKHPKTSSCLVSIGDFYSGEENLRKALELYQKALVAVVDDFNETEDFSANPDIFGSVLSKIELLEALNSKARVLSKLYHSQSGSLDDLLVSLNTYLLANDLVDNIRIGHLTRESKLLLAKNQKDLFYSTIRAALEAYKVTGEAGYKELAFKTVERSKAGVLYDCIRETDAKHFANIPDSLLAQESKLKEDITLLRNLIHEEGMKTSIEIDTVKFALWEDKLFHLENEHNDIVEIFNTNYPKYYQYKYTNKIYTTDEIRECLSDDDVLIEYFLGEGSLLAFCITKDDIRVVENDLEESIFSSLDNLPNNQSVDGIINEARATFNSYTESSYNLYKLLLEPFSDDIKDKNLIIIPDGNLGYVSFESLIKEPADTSRVDYRNLPYLINDHDISYGYSSALLINSIKAEHNNNAKLDLLAFAPVNFGYEDNYKEEIGYRTRGDNLIDLPGSAREVLDISKIFTGDVFMRGQATVGRFKEIASNYKILHIATHGIVDNDDPMHSKLIFSSANDPDGNNALQYGDLFNLDLNADLAVLSACNTGYGKNSEGEGIMALARGFMYSGVPSLVISLWKVEDESTAVIMKNFYKYLKAGHTKDHALRLSKLEYLKTADNIGASPFYWSGFINIGNKDPLDLGNKKLNYLFFLLLLIPVTFFLYTRFKK